MRFPKCFSLAATVSGLMVFLLCSSPNSAAGDGPVFPVRETLLSTRLHGEDATARGFRLLYEPEATAAAEPGSEEKTFAAIAHDTLPAIASARLRYVAVPAGARVEDATRTGEVIFTGGEITSRSPPSNFPGLQDWLVISPAYEFRDWRLASLTLRPVHERTYAGKTVKWILTEAEFDLDYGTVAGNPGELVEHDDAREVLEALVVNDGSLSALARRRPESPEPLPVWLEQPALLVLTEVAGLHQVEQSRIAEVLGADLRKEGISLFQEGKPVPVTFLSDLNGNSSPEFRAGDHLVFYAPPPESPYSTESAFWVTRSGASPRMDVLPPGDFAGEPADLIFRDTAEFEEDHTAYYDEDETMPRNAEQEAYWFWQLVGPSSFGDRTWFERTLPLRDVAAPEDLPSGVEGDVELVFDLAGEDIRRYAPLRPDQLAIRLNGRVLTGSELAVQSTTEERGRLTVRAVLPADTLASTVRNASFTVAIGVAQDLIEGAREQEVSFYVDSFRLRYPRHVQLYHGRTAVDTTLSGDRTLRIPSDWERYQNLVAVARVAEDDYRVLPTRRVAGHFLVEVAGMADVTRTVSLQLQDALTLVRPKRYETHNTPLLRRPNLQADAVILAHPFFRDGAEAYRELYEKRGETARIAWLDDVYREFGQGQPTPYAIRDFLRYAFLHWQQPAPAYVLLIGDASWDWQQRFQNTIPNLLPSYRKDPLYATDNWFVCVTGEDAVPDMFIGRLPVQTLEQLAAVLRKSVLAFEDPQVGPWRGRGIFVSDNYDTAGNLFEKNTRQLMVDWTPPGLDMKQIPFRDYAYEDNRFIPEEYRILEAGKMKYSPDANKAILGAINDGCALFEYFGHGGPNVFGHERILFGGGSVYSDIKNLDNDGQWPFVTGMTCDSGRIDYADVKWNLGIGEELLLHQNGGAIGVFASTGKGYPHQHLPLMEGLHEAIFSQGWRRMGVVTTFPKLLYVLSRPDEIALDMFLLLGDPLAPLPVPETPLEMTLSREVVDLRYGAYLEGTVTLPPDWPEFGLRAHVYARDSEDRPFYSEELRVTGHEFTFGFDVNPDGGPGLYRVGAYVYQTRNKPTDLLLDGVASAGFEALTTAGEPAAVTGTPNLTVRNVTFSDYSPRDGRTIFIDATVANTGEGTARNIGAQAYDGDPQDGGQPVVDIVDWPEQVIERLDPGESEKVHFRWDPFMNAGTHHVYVKADPTSQIAESDETDNQAYQVLQVRQKADLVWDASHVRVTPHPDDPNLLLVNIELQNTGESLAEGVLPPGELRERAGANGFGFAWVLWPAEGALPITQIRAYPALPAGASIPLVLPLPRNAYRMVVVADAEEVVDEITHDNNKYSLYTADALEMVEAGEPGEAETTGDIGEFGEAGATEDTAAE